MWIKEIVIILFGLAGGCVVAGGVFTVFTAVGLIPRFAEQTGSADHILLYENMLILGTLAGLITTVYYDTIAAPVQNSISHGNFAILHFELIRILHGKLCRLSGTIHC